MKLLDLKCKNCKEVNEFLLDSAQVGDLKAGVVIESEVCPSCQARRLYLPNDQVQLDPKHYKHLSWTKWSI